MIHTLHLSTWHPVIDGISGTFVQEQCATLQAAGARVGLIFSRVQGLSSFRLDRLARGMPGFVRTSEPIPTLGFKSWNFPGFAAFAPRLNASMLQNRYSAYVETYGKPNILHPHVALEAGLAARKIAAAEGLDYVLTEHSTEILNDNLIPERAAIASRIYADARCVIAVSPILAERILDISPRANVKVVGNVVRESVFSRRTEPHKTDATIVVVSIGALVSHKRTHHIITALARIPSVLKDRVRHHVIGEGPDRDELKKLAVSGGVQTEFHGNLPHEHAMGILASADIFVHASAYETFGVVVAEAMALGIPVVVTRSGGPNGFVSEDVGCLVDIDDIDGLQNAIETVLGDLPRWRNNKVAISQHAFKFCHESRIGAAIIEAYS